MIIRKYHDADREKIIELLRLNTPQYFDPSEEPELIHYLDNSIENYYVAEIENEIAGCGGINPTDEPERMRIAWDIVHPQSHGKGIGSALTKFRIQKIKEMEDVKTITVRTSQLVYKFYERFGFQVTEIRKDYWAKGFDLYRMDFNINPY